MKIIVFTDLDATLLDQQTYSWEAAAEALEALKTVHAGIVLVSSKTFTEMVPLHRELGLADPFIVENGGAIAFRADSPIASQLLPLRNESDPIFGADYSMVPLGARYEELVRALEEISSEVGSQLRGFAAMSDKEVAELTGLELHEALNARKRDYDEPFVITEAKCIEKEIVDAAEARGLRVVRGGRFWHLVGHEGKEAAVATLLEIYRRIHPQLVTVALGDSPNDFSFLELADFPVLVGGARDGAVLPSSLTHSSRVAQGPEGWNDAILEILLHLKEVGK